MKLQILLRLATYLAIAIYPCLLSAKDSLSSLLIKSAWEELERGQIEKSQLLLEDAASEAELAMNTVLLNEARAKLAWVASLRDQNKRANELVLQVQTQNLAGDDKDRLNLIKLHNSVRSSDTLALFELISESTLRKSPRAFQATVYHKVATASFYGQKLDAAEKLSQNARELLAPDQIHAKFQLLLLEAKVARAREDYARLRNLCAESAKIMQENLSSFSSDDQTDLALLESRRRRDNLDIVGAFEVLVRSRAQLARTLGDNHPALVPLVINQADILVRQGRLVEAKSFCEWCQFYEKDVPKYRSEMLLVQGQIALASGQLRVAEQLLQRAEKDSNIAEMPNEIRRNARSKFWQTILLQGPSNRVESECRSVLDKSTDALDLAAAYCLLSQQKMLVGRLQSAKILSEQAMIAVSRINQQVHQDLYLECLLMHGLTNALAQNANETEHAAQVIIEQTQLVPTISNIWLARALTLKGISRFATGDDQTAQNYFERALEIWGTTSSQLSIRPEFMQLNRMLPLVYLSVLQAERGDIQAAQASWTEATNLSTFNSSSHFQVLIACHAGMICIKEKRMERAVWLFENAKKLAGNSMSNSLALKRLEEELNSQVGQ